MFSLLRVVTRQQRSDVFLSTSLFHFNIFPMAFKSKTVVLESDCPFTIFVEGNIGSGKTSFLSYFEGKQASVHAEPTDIWRNIRGHNVLQLMYQDPTRWCFTFQSLVQKTMLELHVKNDNLPLKLMERSVYSARYCFVENLYKEGFMSAPEYAVLDEWFKWIVTNMKPPGDLIVYLQTDPEVAYKRIKERGRKEESVLQLEYLEKLHQLHEDWLIHNKVFNAPTPVITLDANKSLSEVIQEFKVYEPDILRRISLQQKTKINSINEKSPMKVKNPICDNPANQNLLLNSTGL